MSEPCSVRELRHPRRAGQHSRRGDFLRACLATGMTRSSFATPSSLHAWPPKSAPEPLRLSERLFLSSISTSCSCPEYFPHLRSPLSLLCLPLASPPLRRRRPSAERTPSLSCHSADKLVTLDISAAPPRPAYTFQTDPDGCVELWK